MKKFLALLLTVLVAMTISACGAGNDEAEKDISTQSESSEAENNGSSEVEISEKATVYPLTVKDATGLELTFDKAPERIVSTSPSETEILFALGLGDKIYGVSDFDDYPKEALTKQKVGGVTKPNEETIIAADPDLVIGGISMKDDIVEKFRGLGLTLYKTEPKKLDDILNNIIQIGIITDTQEKAEELVAQMKETIKTVTDVAATIKEEDKKKVYIEFSPGWTVGKGEFMDELITLAGGINIASDMEGWNAINEEKVIQDNPEVILYTAEVVDDKSGKPLEELITSRNGWEKISAIQDGNLTGIEGNIMSRPGPRITDALTQMAEAIYPELFKK
ncbi:iron complex transport system substrate-binding protein [Cytobacillus eiseniae]|uniref:Iron complex transport system substrate-binding protein n=1 Tax=Cytobacillus eiseniae TaxID=762947 RepID=A0ABS4RDI3_9BACI|nr:ABC transporter substrate-binding protein [Cytobacillus eiseniae]MBP2240955.1 iron complex transport system substrate-binding protein [Cytobacillus eiseniae]